MSVQTWGLINIYMLVHAQGLIIVQTLTFGTQENTILSKAVEFGSCSILWKYMKNTNCVYEKCNDNTIIDVLIVPTHYTIIIVKR